MIDVADGQADLVEAVPLSMESQEQMGTEEINKLGDLLEKKLKPALRGLAPRDFEQIEPPHGPAGPYEFYEADLRWLRLGRREFALTYHSPMAAPGGFNGSSGLTELLREP